MYSSTHKLFGPLYHWHPIHLNLQKIYRCWIVWGQNIHVVIIPSLLAIVYLGRSSYHNFITIFFQSIVSSYLATSVSWRNNNIKIHICECIL